MQGVTRYIDEAAVFVGRLVKEKETEATLLQRFQKYGNVVSTLTALIHRLMITVWSLDT